MSQTASIAKKKKRNINKAAVRAYAGASLEVIQKKRQEKPEARKATREAALREVRPRYICGALQFWGLRFCFIFTCVLWVEEGWRDFHQVV